MTVSLFWQIQPENFDAWLNPDPDGLAQMFKDQGVLAYSLHRGTEDPNATMTHLRFTDEKAVESFLAWYEGAKAAWEAEFPGTKHETVATWVGEDVEGYSATLT